MKECGILYSRKMILARKSGRKSQTRRVVKPQSAVLTDAMARTLGVRPPPIENQPVITCPYGQPGDRLWAREEHRILFFSQENKNALVEYRADGEHQWCDLSDADVAQLVSRKTPLDRWMQARFMLRSFARFVDELTDVRVERVHDISEEDAIAEGIYLFPGEGGGYKFAPGEQEWDTAREAYLDFWDSIYGQESLDANPWVWALTFRPIEGGKAQGISARTF